jgi:hypothetical protein
MVMRTTIWLLIAASSFGACNWTEFDDLEDQTWVNSTKKPNVKSTDYGVAIQRGGDGRLVVIGAGQATYSELIYDPKGDSSLAPTTLELNSQFGIGNLDPQPIVLASPSSNDVALIVNGGGDQLLVLEGSQGDLKKHQVFVQPSTVDGATYMQAPPRIDAGHVGEAQPIQTLVAAGDFVLGTFYANVPNPQPKCKLTDKGASIQPRALGAVKNGAVDDVLAWGSGGTLYRYPSSVFLGCATMQEPLTSVATGFMPGHGSQILALDATHVLLQGHQDSGNAAILQVYDVGATPPVAVGGSVSLDNLRTAAILDAGGTKYVIAGYPTTVVDGKSAGQVLLFKITATGLDSMPAATLHDAQPESNQSFGRAVAAMPFQGKQVIAVAGDNEIFVYFRAQLTDGTPLYDETRQGR